MIELLDLLVKYSPILSLLIVPLIVGAMGIRDEVRELRIQFANHEVRDNERFEHVDSLSEIVTGKDGHSNRIAVMESRIQGLAGVRKV